MTQEKLSRPIMPGHLPALSIGPGEAIPLATNDQAVNAVLREVRRLSDGGVDQLSALVMAIAVVARDCAFDLPQLQGLLSSAWAQDPPLVYLAESGCDAPG